MKSNYQSFYQRVEIRPDQAFVLSNAVKLQFPKPTEIKQNIFSTLASMVLPQNKNKNSQQNKCLVPIPNEMFLMACGNSIVLYKHWQTDNQQLQCEQQASLQLSYYIKTIKISPYSKCKKGKDFTLIVEDCSSNYLQILEYLAGTKQLKCIKIHKVASQMNCWSFIQNHQILIWCQNMKIYHYELKSYGLKLIQTLDSGIKLNEEVLVQDKKRRSRSKNKDLNKYTKKLGAVSEQGDKKLPFTLNFSTIIGQRGKQQDSVLVLFYVLYNQQLNGMKIKCKQIIYPFQNEQNDTYYNFLKYSNQFPKLKMKPKIHQIISNNTANPQILQTLSIVQTDDVILVRFQYEIIVIQKKFDQYLALDNIYKKTKQSIVSMAYNSNIISCTTDKILQMNQIQISQNKVHTTMIDFIDLQSQFQRLKTQANKNAKVEDFHGLNKLKKLISKQGSVNQDNNKDNGHKQRIQQFKRLKNQSKLFSMWVSTDLLHQLHRNNVYFVFQIPSMQKGQSKYDYLLYLTQHIPRIKKLTNLAHKAKDINDIENYRKLGEVLGVDSSQFYFNMWKTSQQSYEQILAFLLKCKNFKKIIPQLKNFLRKRSQPATKLLKVMQKLQNLTLQILKQKLTQQFLIDYFHVVFLHRKFQVFSSEYEIDQRQFTSMVQISLYDLVRKIIDKQLFPETQKPSLWMMEPKQPPKINLIQVLDLFKLPLLYQYDNFLRNILLSYPDHIISVIDNFPELLPEYPFEQYEVVMSTSISNPKIKQSTSIKQKQFFAPIKYENLISQANFLKNTLNYLYKYYSTSLILKSFDQALKSGALGQKYLSHTIIQEQFDIYVKKIKEITGIRLYIVTLDCLVKCKYNNDIQSNSSIQILCDILKKHHNLKGEKLQQLQVTACVYELMIKYSIIDALQVSLQEVYSQPIEKWIALFFLGNKQQKDLIFTQFMEIFKNKNHFVETLRKFIASEHCSKIQINFLIDLITHTNQQFQRENQSIIDVIIDGFCAKVQICDTPDANNFKQRLRTIQMGQQLLIKADKIEKMGLCKRIFSIFSMQNILLKDLMTKTTEVMQQMLQNFFNGNIKQSKIAISNKKVLQIQLKQVNNMFQLLKYLRQNVLFNVSAEELVILYCKKLVQWQEFAQINQFIYNCSYLENQDLNQQEIVQKIQGQILQDLYDDEQKVYYNAQTRKFIQNVLNIQKKPQRNSIVIQQRAKMQIVQIFRIWGFEIKLSLLSYMCRRWQQLQQESNREAAYGGILCRPIMKSIIQGYSQYLDYRSLEQLYKYFMVVSTLKVNPQTKTDQFYQYCTKLGDRLMQLDRLKQASQIICVVNQRFQMNYRLMGQCLLKSLIYIYLEKKQDQSIIQIQSKQYSKQMSHHQSFQLDSSQKKITNQQKKKDDKMMFNFTPIPRAGVVQIGQAGSFVCSEEMEEYNPLVIIKRYIDVFAFSWIQQNQQNMKEIFSDFFQDELQDGIINQFQISSDLCFKQHHHKLKSEYIWKICQQIWKKIQGTDQKVLIYCYFFLLMGLVQPETGFSLIDYISYNYEILFNFLKQFKDQCDRGNQLLFLDYSIIFERYLDALTQLLIQTQQQSDSNEEINESKKKNDSSISKPQNEQSQRIQSKPNLNVVRQLIRKGQYKNDPLALLIRRMTNLTVDAQKNVKKRLNTYTNYISIKKFDLTMTIRTRNKKKAQKAQHVQPIVINEHQQQNSIQKPLMMSFDQFKKMKNRIKNDKTLSRHLLPGLDITQRVIVQQIFGVGDNGSKKQTSRKQIPGLRDLITISLKELEQKQQQKQKQKPNLTQSVTILNLQQDRTKQSPRKEYHQDQLIFTQAIKSQNYSTISNWSTDAILIQTGKNYKNKDISFPMVIKMFHQLCVGDHTKIDVLWISQPEHLKIDSQILKKIFPIDYLKSQFGSYAHFQSQLLNKMYIVIDQLTASQIKQIAFFLNDVAKLQYKKASRDHWLNILGMTAITKQAQNKKQKQCKKQRLQTLFNILTQDYRNREAQNIIRIFEIEQAHDLIPYLRQRLHLQKK